MVRTKAILVCGTLEVQLFLRSIAAGSLMGDPSLARQNPAVFWILEFLRGHYLSSWEAGAWSISIIQSS